MCGNCPNEARLAHVSLLAMMLGLIDGIDPPCDNFPALRTERFFNERSCTTDEREGDDSDDPVDISGDDSFYNNSSPVDSSSNASPSDDNMEGSSDQQRLIIRGAIHRYLVTPEAGNLLLSTGVGPMETFLITEAMTVVETNLLPVVQFEVRSAVHDRHQYLLFLLQEPAVQGGEAQAQAQHMAANTAPDPSPTIGFQPANPLQVAGSGFANTGYGQNTTQVGAGHAVFGGLGQLSGSNRANLGGSSTPLAPAVGFTAARPVQPASLNSLQASTLQPVIHNDFMTQNAWFNNNNNSSVPSSGPAATYVAPHNDSASASTAVHPNAVLAPGTASPAQGDPPALTPTTAPATRIPDRYDYQLATGEMKVTDKTKYHVVCPECSCKFLRNSMRTHMAREHPDKFPTYHEGHAVPSHTCLACGESFPKKGQRDSHTLEVHGQGRNAQTSDVQKLKRMKTGVAAAFLATEAAALNSLLLRITIAENRLQRLSPGYCSAHQLDLTTHPTTGANRTEISTSLSRVRLEAQRTILMQNGAYGTYEQVAANLELMVRNFSYGGNEDDDVQNSGHEDQHISEEAEGNENQEDDWDEDIYSSN